MILISAWFGFGFGLGCCVGIWPTILAKSVASIVCWIAFRRAALVMVPVHLLVESAFQWNSKLVGWDRPGLPVLSNLAGPFQRFRAAVLDAWTNKVTTNLCGRSGFRGGPFLDIRGTLQLLHSDHVRERDKALLRGEEGGRRGKGSFWRSVEWLSFGEHLE